ncbi:MAG: CPBP family intramembrane metalloprotease, partial [Bacteroidales bacterium]|nr:CPBP family intramembrane metalloprotease [Bacteroidales bacterium]
MSSNFFSIQNTPPWLQFIYFILISVGCFILFSTVAVLTVIALGGNTLAPSMILITQSITFLGTFILPALWFGYARQEGTIQFFKLSTNFNPKWLWWLLLWIVSVPLLGYIVRWNAHVSLPSSFSALENWMRDMEQTAKNITNILLSQNTSILITLNVLVIALLPAIGEELFFRGVVLRVLLEWWKKKHIAVWVSAVIFSTLHFQFFGFIPRILLGVLLGYAYVYSGSLIVPIFVHFVNNASAVLLYESNSPVLNSEFETP